MMERQTKRASPRPAFTHLEIELIKLAPRTERLGSSWLVVGAR